MDPCLVDGYAWRILDLVDGLGLPSYDCLARTENLQLVLRLEVRRNHPLDEPGCSLFQSHANAQLAGLDLKDPSRSLLRSTDLS